VNGSFVCSRNRFPLYMVFLLALGWVRPCLATIRYEVSLDHPEQHLFHVTVTIPNVSGEVTVQMPAWNAIYQIRDFSSHVREVQAFVGNANLPIAKMDKQTWKITGQGTITIRYATLWDEPGPFATQLNDEHAFINPAMILVYVPERRSEDVFLALPDVPDRWNVASAALTARQSAGGLRLFMFAAKNYDELADSPIEAGKFDQFDLNGVSPKITVVVHGDNWRKGQVEENLRHICQYEILLMEGAPFERYLFLLHIGKAAAGAGGGMEHANSTAIAVSSDASLPGVAAHEFFHLWNVKRIRPASLEPVDYTKEQFTRALWFAEGVTSTYASYTLVRSGLWSKQQFYQDLGQQISELETRPANRWQSAEQSSLDTWLEKYALYNTPEGSVSYYTKGQVLGVLLDVLIRDRTYNQKSLDDVARAMNSDFAKQGKTYRDSLDIRLTVEKLVGASFEDFFRDYVAGTKPFPYENVLALAGLKLRALEQKLATLGFSIERDPASGLTVRSVESASSAAQAGLRPGDVILGWNAAEPPRRPSRWVLEQSPGDRLRLRVRRDEKELAVEFALGETSETLYSVEENPRASEKARRIRESMLQAGTEGTTVH
jgi:predicted metalloprotease with PDZ domain